MSSHHVQLRKDREESVYFGTNADDLADVQMVVFTQSMSIFFDFTIDEAESLYVKLGGAINDQRAYMRRIESLTKARQPKQRKRKSSI